MFLWDQQSVMLRIEATVPSNNCSFSRVEGAINLPRYRGKHGNALHPPNLHRTRQLAYWAVRPQLVMCAVRSIRCHTPRSRGPIRTPTNSEPASIGKVLAAGPVGPSSPLSSLGPFPCLPFGRL